jgi:outer membrane receptor protein involved in Fe transport
VESSALKAADVTTLQNNPTLIVGSQLPGVPLHKGQVALDATLLRGIDVRLTQTFLSAGNSKNAPAYNYGDLLINAPFSSQSSVNLGVNNVFNQYANYTGLIGHGVPAALNQYASAPSYAPLTGASATELFALPYRQLFISYSYHVR